MEISCPLDFRFLAPSLIFEGVKMRNDASAEKTKCQPDDIIRLEHRIEASDKAPVLLWLEAQRFSWKYKYQYTYYFR